MEQVPCRVSADLRQHQAEQNLADLIERMPYFADTEDLDGVVSDDLKAAIAALFLTRDQVLAGQRVNDMDKARALEWLLRDLSALERALYHVWVSA